MNELNRIIQEFQNFQTSGLLMQVLQFILWALIILFLSWLARKGINKTITDNSLRYKVRKFTRLISYILILLLAIITFTGKVQYFTLAIGLISAGLAFALQEVILSIAGWIAIFSSNIYKTGDRIEIGKIKGDVIDIGITKTTLMEIGEWVNSDNYSGRIVQISNAQIFKGTVHNYSTDFPFVWDEIILPVKYGSDIKLASQIMLDSAHRLLTDYTNYAKEHWKKMVKNYMIENAHVEPSISLKLTDNWVEYNLRYVVDYKKRRATKHQLFSEIYTEILKTKGSVHLASATFEILEMPRLNVELEEEKKSGIKSI